MTQDIVEDVMKKRKLLRDLTIEVIRKQEDRDKIKDNFMYLTAARG
jgi:hypothetical protein